MCGLQNDILGDISIKEQTRWGCTVYSTLELSLKHTQLIKELCQLEVISYTLYKGTKFVCQDHS